MIITNEQINITITDEVNKRTEKNLAIVKTIRELNKDGPNKNEMAAGLGGKITHCINESCSCSYNSIRALQDGENILCGAASIVFKLPVDARKFEFIVVLEIVLVNWLVIIIPL